MRRPLAGIIAILVTLLGTVAAHAADLTPNCAGAAGTTCGVGSDHGAGVFHGLIAVSGSPWVLDDAASHGGCGDCTWTVLQACASESPTDPGSADDCALLNHTTACAAGELLFRIYLTTGNEVDHVEGTVCIGGDHQVIPISDQAAADVARYLRDVIPPDVQVTTRPDNATLAGLPTYFSASPPRGLRPAPFGGPDIVETITIAPTAASWRFGDGTGSGWVGPDRRETHRYVSGDDVVGQVTTRWGASYTISYAGDTFGPYGATGQLTKQQTFTLHVRTTTPTLVSH